ncbi:MAG: TetR family transcriptional regulator [Gammaproteobacteria bacterium]|nr:TetR family transcriptional regulator [Gammaproteobacteria bacterium]
MAKRLHASERRASILAVAKVLFADKGYHGVSVDEIAALISPLFVQAGSVRSGAQRNRLQA